MADGEVTKPPDNVTKPSFADVAIGKLTDSDTFTPQGRPPVTFEPQTTKSISLTPFSKFQACDSPSRRQKMEISLKPISIYQGRPSVLFKSSDKQIFLEKLKFVLVGKFSHGRPPISSIKTFFTGLKLQGWYNISIFDSKHIFIEVDLRMDYTRLWMKLNWKVDGFPMRIFKWDHQFSPRRESAIAPVWIRIEGLPLYMFDEMPLLSVANAIGSPIRIHPLNINRVKLNSALICVELDVSKPLIDSIWVSFEDDSKNSVLEGFWLNVFYDVIPHYCSSCLRIGHHFSVCKKNKVEDCVNSAEQKEATTAPRVLAEMPQPDHRKRNNVRKVTLAQKETQDLAGSSGKTVADLTQEFAQPVDCLAQPDVVNVADEGGHECQVPCHEDKVQGAATVFSTQPSDPQAIIKTIAVDQSVSGQCSDMADLQGEQHGDQVEPVGSNQQWHPVMDKTVTKDSAVGVQALSLPAPVEDTPDREDQQNPVFPDTEKATSQVQADITIRETVSAVVEVVKQQCTPEVDKMAAKPRMKSVINTEGYVSKYTSQNIKADTTLQKLHGEVPKDCSPKQKEQGPFQEKKNPQKQQPKPFHTDLPIDFDPIMCNQETEGKKLWSQLVGGVKLLVRRSISPIGRSSEKLIKLRKRVEFIEYDAGKTFAMDLDEYLEGNKEQFQLKAKDPPTPSRNHRPRRRRGQARVEDGNGHGPDRGRNRDRR